MYRLVLGMKLEKYIFRVIVNIEGEEYVMFMLSMKY